jgi:soluble lytic murein transglycosylase
MILPTRPRVARLSLCALLVCALALAFVPGVAHTQEGPTEAPSATPQPTPSPPDPVLAAELAARGELEGAIAAYRAVIAQGSDAERLAAHLPLARAYIDDGQVAAAVRQLDAFLLEAPAGTDVRAAQYLLAEALSAQGAWDEAFTLYDAYVGTGGGAATYARMGLAEALARIGRGAEGALEAERLLLERELPDSVRLAFMLAMAQALEGEEPQAAIDWYERLGRESEFEADKALALWRAELLGAELAGRGTSLSVALEIVQEYPETSTALEVVENFPVTTAILDGFDFGLVYYYNGRADEARELFEEQLHVQPPNGNTARAQFYLAVFDENAGDLEDAIAGYTRVLEIDDGVEVADDAAWWRARLIETTGSGGEARAAYRDVVDRFGGSDFADEARFRLALLDYDARAYDAAADAFGELAGDWRGEDRQRARFWQGRALEAAGDDEAAEATWRATVDEAPADYYGLRAAVLLGDARSDLRDAGIDEDEEPDWAAIESWLRDITSDDPSSALESVLYDRHWGLTQELLALGMRRRAGAELGLLLERAGDPSRLYQVARFARTAGLHDISARAAARLLLAVPERAAESAPADLWRLAYPAPFLPSLRAAADEFEVPDVLLLALVRQESFFDPLAGSTAGALGLAQVIPPTGAEIAEGLAIDGFETEHLFRPGLSLRFGAFYLSEQLELFDGNVYPALAAYNAGPGNALRWWETADGDFDRFVEEIEFAQTRAYVRLVSENLARYRQLYQGLDEPQLPRD